MVASQRIVLASTRPRLTLLRASVVLLAGALISRVATVASDSFVAARFGLSTDADVYLLAVGLIWALLAAPSEALRMAIVPVCGPRLHAGERRQAAGVVGLLLALALLVGALGALALVISLPWIAPWLAPGLSAQELTMLVQAGRLLSLALVFGLALALFLGLMDTQLRFGIPAVVGIGLSAGVIGAGTLLGSALGVRALALGFVLGMVAVVLALAWLSREVFREGVNFQGAFEEIGSFLRLAGPTALAVSFVGAGLVIERAVASATGAGNVAALGFAVKIATQAAVVAQSIWIPLTPLMTASRSAKEQGRSPLLVFFSLKLMLLILVPVAALLIALREPLVALLFERGAFTAADTERTATLLALHSGSSLGEGVFLVAVAAFLALKDAWMRLSASGLFIVSKVALLGALAPTLGAAGVALAASLSSLVAGTYAVAALGHRLPSADLRTFLAFAGKVTVAGLLALVIAAFASEGVVGWGSDPTLGERIVQLVCGGLAAGAVYVAALVALRIEEATVLVSRAQAWLGETRG